MVKDQMPSAYIQGEWTSYNRKYSVDEVADFYIGLKFPMRNSVLIPRELAHDPDLPLLAAAQGGGLAATKRSGSAYRVNRQMFSTLKDTDGPFSASVVGETMRNKFLVSGSTQMCRGRFTKYYSKNLMRATRIPPTEAEAELSMRDSGCVMTGPPPKPLLIAQSLSDPEESEYIQVNLNSDLGYPVQGKGTSEGALERVLLLSRECRTLLEECCAHLSDPIEKAKRVEEEIYRWQDTLPHLVLVKGKCKMDYYKEEKIAAEEMRFYNALPKHLVFIMQQATQPFEHQTQGLFEHPHIHSAQKVVLVRGGADRLVQILDEQLADGDVAYVHVGDDSWVVIRDGEYLVFCALDCSSFDLTQHSSISLPVHRIFRNHLATIDPVSAGVWMAFVRKRLLVIEKSVTVLMEHGGPSGIPMQSKVNDVLMDIAIKRVLRRIEPGMDEAAVNRVMKETGDDLGFTIKVEQFQRVRAPTVREALKQIRFQFVGYYFYTNERNFVYPFIDLPRSMSQMAYPAGKWVPDSYSFKTTEVMRLVSIAMGSGIAPDNVRAQLAMYQECSILLIEELGKRSSGELDREDPRLRWATQIAPHAMGEEDVQEFSASVRGLGRAFDEGRGAQRLWRHPDDVPPPSKKVYSVRELLALRPTSRLPTDFPGEDELPGTSTLVPIGVVDESLFTAVHAPLRQTHGLGGHARADLLEAGFEPVENPHPSEISRKTLGRKPRLKKESRAEQFKRIGRQHKLDAQLRRLAEEERDNGGHGGLDLNARRNARADKGRAGASRGLQAARVSAEDVEARDLRRRGGSGKKGGRRKGGK